MFVNFYNIVWLKSSESLFRAFLAEQLDEMGFTPSIADPNVWIRPVTESDDEQCYKFILVYVDNLLAISQDAVSVIRRVADKFKNKKDKIKPPDIYLRGRINGNQVWTISSVDYMKSVLNNLEKRLKKKCMKLPARATTPMSYDYKPDLDATAELDANNINMFQ